MNKIVIEFSAEDRARLDRIADLLDQQTQPAPAAYFRGEPDAPKTGDKPVEKVEAIETPTEPEKQEETKETAPWEAPAPAAPAAPTTPTVTLEQIQQKVVQLVALNGGAKKAQVRAIINAHAPKVSELPEDKMQEVWEQLTALESEG